MARAHGVSGYNGGCRCEVCTTANTERGRARRKLAKFKLDVLKLTLSPEVSVGLSIACALEGREPAELVSELLDATFGGLGPVDLQVADHGLSREQHAWAGRRWPALSDRAREAKFRALSSSRS
jgi:hypothetical protein